MCIFLVARCSLGIPKVLNPWTLRRNTITLSCPCFPLCHTTDTY